MATLTNRALGVLEKLWNIITLSHVGLPSGGCDHEDTGVISEIEQGPDGFRPVVDDGIAIVTVRTERYCTDCGYITEILSRDEMGIELMELE